MFCSGLPISLVWSLWLVVGFVRVSIILMEFGCACPSTCYVLAESLYCTSNSIWMDGRWKKYMRFDGRVWPRFWLDWSNELIWLEFMWGGVRLSLEFRWCSCLRMVLYRSRLIRYLGDIVCEYDSFVYSHEAMFGCPVIGRCSCFFFGTHLVYCNFTQNIHSEV